MIWTDEDKFYFAFPKKTQAILQLGTQNARVD